MHIRRLFGLLLVLLLTLEGSARSLDSRSPQVTAEGVQAPKQPGHARAYSPPPRLDAWIGLPEERERSGPRKGAVTCLRKTLTLDSAPAEITAWVSADIYYRLYINGVLVSRGPADPGEDYPGGKSRGSTGITYCDQRDLTPFLHKGVNVIAAEVFTERFSSWYGSTGHSGFYFQARGKRANGTPVALSADETWKALKTDYLTHDRGMTCQPAKEPDGWQLPGFDDNAWRSCVKTANHWPGLRTSEIPPPMEVTYPAARAVRVSPGIRISERPFRDDQSVTLASNGSFTLQYDRVISAYVRLKVVGGAGATLHLALNESNAPGGNRGMNILLKEGEQTVETPFYSSFTVINITASEVTAPIEIKEISAQFVSQPVTYRGAFECSRDDLNRLWKSARWATQICMQDHYLDSPDHQEPICDPGDYMIEALLNACAFNEPALTRQDLRKFAALLANNDYINFHTSYSLLWLQMLLDYYDHTGDEALVRELSPQVEGLLAKFETWRGKNGLISEAPDYMFMDWVDVHGIACHHPPAVIGQGYMTAFYYRGLWDGRRVAALLGKTELAAKYEHLRQDTAAAFNRELWSEAKGRYRDGRPFQTSVKPGPWLPADTDIETFSPHVSVLAVLYDLAPAERQQAILAKVLEDRPLNCQPYFMHFVFNALAHAGLFERYATDLMRRWEILPHSGTAREMWDRGDLSHAWGGTPLYQLSARVLGITPLKPGFDVISINPLVCDLTFARGSVPTRHGDVRVNWRKEPGALSLTVVIPQGAKAELALPATQNPRSSVTLEGRTVWKKDAPAGRSPVRRSGTELLLELSAGRHEIRYFSQ